MSAGRTARSIAPRNGRWRAGPRRWRSTSPPRHPGNTIGPTFIETPLTKPFFENAAFKDWVLSKIKLGRLGQVTDLMGAVVFLASDASALMTGSAMLVDGGWTAE